jgi:hypothetical protein
MRYLEELAKNLSVNEHDALSSISSVIERLGGPAQRVEFIAKRLLNGSVNYAPKTHCVIASPLYVAMAE